MFCQKYPNFARSLYSVLQWALSYPNTVSSDSWRLCLSEKYIDHSYILIFLSWWPSFRTLWNVAPVTAVRETRVQTKGEISLGSCLFFFLQPLKGLCLSLSPSRTKAIKSLEWKGQGASCASMEASKPCSDHPALQRGSNTRFRQDKRLPSHVTWSREKAFLESYRIPLCGMTVCSERWHLSNSLDQWSWFFVREKKN